MPCFTGTIEKFADADNPNDTAKQKYNTIQTHKHEKQGIKKLVFMQTIVINMHKDRTLQHALDAWLTCLFMKK